MWGVQCVGVQSVRGYSVRGIVWGVQCGGYMKVCTVLVLVDTHLWKIGLMCCSTLLQ